MNPNPLHPNIKEGLDKHINRSAPMGLQQRIMNRIRAMQQADIMAPNANPILIVAHLVAIIMIALPLWFNYSGQQLDLPALEAPVLNVPNYVWYCLAFFMALFAFTERSRFNSKQKQH